MNTDQLLAILESELQRTIPNVDIKILKINKINTVVNSNLRLMGDAFTKGKYKNLSADNYLGFNPVRLNLLRNGNPSHLDLVVKGHPPGMFTENVYPHMLEHFKINLSQAIENTFVHREFKHLFANEYYHYELQHHYPIFASYCPKYYGRYWDKETDETFVFLELVKEMTHLNDLSGVEQWDKELFAATMKGIAHLHQPFYNKPELLSSIEPNILGPFNQQDFYSSVELWEQFAFNLKRSFPDLVDDTFYASHLALIKDIPNWYPVMDESAKTIIHSDYNPRNIGFRTLHSKPSVVILDWECVRWDIPQYDIAQFILYAAKPHNIVEFSSYYLELYRVYFESISGLSIDKTNWFLGFQAAIRSHLIDRAPLLALIFVVYPGAEFNIGTLMYQNAKTLLNAWQS